MEKLIESHRNNPELQCTLNIDEILDSAENVDVEYIGNHSLQTISKEVVDHLKQHIDESLMCKYTNSLLNYRLIDEVYHIHKGKHVRWLRNGKLTNGGIVVDVQFTDNGTQILCKTNSKFIRYQFDDCTTFQKLTDDELLILQLKDSV